MARSSGTPKIVLENGQQTNRSARRRGAHAQAQQTQAPQPNYGPSYGPAQFPGSPHLDPYRRSEQQAAAYREEAASVIPNPPGFWRRTGRAAVRGAKKAPAELADAGLKIWLPFLGGVAVLSALMLNSGGETPSPIPYLDKGTAESVDTNLINQTFPNKTVPTVTLGKGEKTSLTFTVYEGTFQPAGSPRAIHNPIVTRDPVTHRVEIADYRRGGDQDITIGYSQHSPEQRGPEGTWFRNDGTIDPVHDAVVPIVARTESLLTDEPQGPDAKELYLVRADPTLTPSLTTRVTEQHPVAGLLEQPVLPPHHR
jgi:hypothetical protein